MSTAQNVFIAPPPFWEYSDTSWHPLVAMLVGTVTNIFSYVEGLEDCLTLTTLLCALCST